jgi:heme-degrading monooxygenase HmoA
MDHSGEPNERAIYRIRVKGVLDQSWSDWFDGLTITPQANGNTLLTGPLRDQAALHGLLAKVRDMGLALLSVTRTDAAGERKKMISRIWHGWTTLGNADKYEAMLKDEIFVGIQNRRIRGFKGIQLLRRKVGAEVEFVTIMVFDSLDAVREFAGEDYERAVVPKNARAVLSHFDERSQHYEIMAERRGEG